MDHLGKAIIFFFALTIISAIGVGIGIGIGIPYLWHFITHLHYIK